MGSKPAMEFIIKPPNAKQREKNHLTCDSTTCNPLRYVEGS